MQSINGDFWKPPRFLLGETKKSACSKMLHSGVRQLLEARLHRTLVFPAVTHLTQIS